MNGLYAGWGMPGKPIRGLEFVLRKNHMAAPRIGLFWRS